MLSWLSSCLSSPSGCCLLPQLVVVARCHQHHVQSICSCFLYCCVKMSLHLLHYFSSWQETLVAITALTAVAPLPCPTDSMPPPVVKVDCNVFDGVNTCHTPCLQWCQCCHCCCVVLLIIIAVSLSSYQHHCCCRSKLPWCKGWLLCFDSIGTHCPACMWQRQQRIVVVLSSSLLSCPSHLIAIIV